MHPSIVNHRTTISEICERIGVVRLDGFGSGSDIDRFVDAKSDFDFLVGFSERSKAKAFDDYFALREGLQRVLGRPIDLVTTEQVRNPFFRKTIEASRRNVFGG